MPIMRRQRSKKEGDAKQPEVPAGREKMRHEFARLDERMRNNVDELARRAKEGGLAYELAIKACNRSELSDMAIAPNDGIYEAPKGGFGKKDVLLDAISDYVGTRRN